MYFRQLLNDDTACASYLLGCKSRGAFVVVDPHAALVDDYIARAETQGAAIVAVLETHVQADHVSGLPDLVARTGATGCLPASARCANSTPAPAGRQPVAPVRATSSGSPET